MASTDPGFKDYLVSDCMHGLGVTSRAMFGGYCLYQAGTVFGIVIADKLYFYATDKNAALFDSVGAEPFTYESKNGNTAAMPYREVPETVYENRDQLTVWVDAAVEAKKQDLLLPKRKNSDRICLR